MVFGGWIIPWKYCHEQIDGQPELTQKRITIYCDFNIDWRSHNLETKIIVSGIYEQLNMLNRKLTCIKDKILYSSLYS